MTIGHTAAIIEAEARSIPARIRIMFEVYFYISKNTMAAKRKKVKTEIMMAILRRVDMIPKKDSFYFFVFMMT